MLAGPYRQRPRWRRRIGVMVPAMAKMVVVGVMVVVPMHSRGRDRRHVAAVLVGRPGRAIRGHDV